VNINFLEIREKYPKSYNKFLDDCGRMNPHWIDNICYCDLEKFFCNNEIIINIIFRPEENHWSYKIFHNGTFVIYDWMETIDEAKEQAILTAFEVMEGR